MLWLLLLLGTIVCFHLLGEHFGKGSNPAKSALDFGLLLSSVASARVFFRVRYAAV